MSATKYAVVKTGGKQLRVSPGDLVRVERLNGDPGQQIALEEVLMVGGDAVKVGTPRVEGAKVLATIQGELKGPKITIFKMKRRKRYRLTKGHRQKYTQLRIDSIDHRAYSYHSCMILNLLPVLESTCSIVHVVFQ